MLSADVLKIRKRNIIADQYAGPSNHLRNWQTHLLSTLYHGDCVHIFHKARSPS